MGFKNAIKDTFRKESNFKYLLLAVLITGLSYGLYKGMLDNFLAEVVQMGEMDRGVTLLHGEGGYRHTPTEIVMSIISNRELIKLERLGHSIDPECFMVISKVTEVHGRGFTRDRVTLALEQQNGEES